jgi:hypothetical protein
MIDGDRQGAERDGGLPQPLGVLDVGDQAVSGLTAKTQPSVIASSVDFLAATACPAEDLVDPTTMGAPGRNGAVLG